MEILIIAALICCYMWYKYGVEVEKTKQTKIKEDAVTERMLLALKASCFNGNLPNNPPEERNEQDHKR